MFDIVIHHAKCLDGFTAAWVASKFCPDAQFISASYGEVFDSSSIIGKKILMVDFSLPRDQMIEMAKTNELVVLDHHKTAEANLKGLDFCTFDMERSGAGLCLDYFLNEAPDITVNLVLRRYAWIIQFVDFVEDRDLWRFKFPATKTVNAALGTYPFTLQAYEDFVNEGLQAALLLGVSIMRMQEKQILENISKVYYIWFGGHENVAVVNCSEMSIISELCNRACHNHPFAVAWRVAPDKIYLSLRSDDTGIDVSEVAKIYGGGGHAHAAGAELPLDSYYMLKPFEIKPYSASQIEHANS